MQVQANKMELTGKKKVRNATDINMFSFITSPFCRIQLKGFQCTFLTQGLSHVDVSTFINKKYQSSGMIIQSLVQNQIGVTFSSVLITAMGFLQHQPSPRPSQKNLEKKKEAELPFSLKNYIQDCKNDNKYNHCRPTYSFPP